eukprot:g5.t1
MQDLNSLTMYYLQADQQHLVVIANSADGLPVADPDYGSSNPFVRVKYDGTVESSPVVMASLTPIWNHIFYLPVRFTDPCIYKDPAYKKNVFAEEMRSKGFLDARMELEIWHWDGVPTEFLGSYKLDLVKVRYGQQIDRAICNAATKTRKVADSNEADEDQKKEDTGDATVGIDPALAKVHSTYLYEGKREKISGSSLTTQATPTISFECYFLPDFKPDFKFPEQDDKEIASAQTFAPAYTRWNNIFKELNEAYEVWFPDSPAKRRWLCSFNDKSGKTLPLPRLITPLALPAELGSPLSIMHWIKCVEFSAPARQRACGQINEWQTPNDMLALRPVAIPVLLLEQDGERPDLTQEEGEWLKTDPNATNATTGYGRGYGQWGNQWSKWEAKDKEESKEAFLRDTKDAKDSKDEKEDEKDSGKDSDARIAFDMGSDDEVQIESLRCMFFRLATGGLQFLFASFCGLLFSRDSLRPPVRLSDSVGFSDALAQDGEQKSDQWSKWGSNWKKSENWWNSSNSNWSGSGWKSSNSNWWKNDQGKMPRLKRMKSAPSSFGVVSGRGRRQMMMTECLRPLIPGMPDTAISELKMQVETWEFHVARDVIVKAGAEHAWVLTREGYGTITFWEVTTGAKYHLAQRWIGKTDERSVPEVDKRWQEKQATADWKSEKALEDRANFSRQQHLASMDQLYRLPIAPWPELYKADTITDVPFASIEVVFNGYNDVAIPVGPKVSAHTAETLERNIENELKESIRMIRMRIGFESAYEDSEVRDEALRAYLLHLEKECVLDVDWAYDEADWKHPNDHNGTVNLIKIKNTLKTARQYLAVKENHVLSGVPLHFSSTDLKEPIEYFRYPSDDIFFFAVAKVIPLPQSVCSVWVFMGAEVKMSRERIMQLSKEGLFKWIFGFAVIWKAALRRPAVGEVSAAEESNGGSEEESSENVGSDADDSEKEDPSDDEKHDKEVQGKQASENDEDEDEDDSSEDEGPSGKDGTEEEEEDDQQDGEEDDDDLQGDGKKQPHDNDKEEEDDDDAKDSSGGSQKDGENEEDDHDGHEQEGEKDDGQKDANDEELSSCPEEDDDEEAEDGDQTHEKDGDEEQSSSEESDEEKDEKQPSDEEARETDLDEEQEHEGKPAPSNKNIGNEEESSKEQEIGKRTHQERANGANENPSEFGKMLTRHLFGSDSEEEEDDEGVKGTNDKAEPKSSDEEGEDEDCEKGGQSKKDGASEDGDEGGKPTGDEQLVDGQNPPSWYWEGIPVDPKQWTNEENGHEAEKEDEEDHGSKKQASSDEEEDDEAGEDHRSKNQASSDEEEDDEAGEDHGSKKQASSDEEDEEDEAGEDHGSKKQASSDEEDEEDEAGEDHGSKKQASSDEEDEDEAAHRSAKQASSDEEDEDEAAHRSTKQVSSDEEDEDEEAHKSMKQEPKTTSRKKEDAEKSTEKQGCKTNEKKAKKKEKTAEKAEGKKKDDMQVEEAGEAKKKDKKKIEEKREANEEKKEKASASKDGKSLEKKPKDEKEKGGKKEEAEKSKEKQDNKTKEKTAAHKKAKTSEENEEVAKTHEKKGSEDGKRKSDCTSGAGENDAEL